MVVSNISVNIKVYKRRKHKLVKFDSLGYLVIYKPDHPRCNKKGYIRLHRFVYEYFFKCCLLPWVDVHHINKIKTDNHKSNLLLAVTRSEHNRIHSREGRRRRKIIDKSKRYCYICKSKTTYIDKRNWSHWHKDVDGFLCNLCYDNVRYKSSRLL